MRRLSCLALVLGAALLATGCSSRSAYVTLHPGWPYQDYRVLAVVPGRPADPAAEHHGEILADRLSSLLERSHVFTVREPSEQVHVWIDPDPGQPGGDPAVIEGQQLVVPAVVVPRITDFKLIAERTERVVPIYATDPYGHLLVDRYGRRIIIGERHTPIYRHGAEVEATLRVVDTATGHVLLSQTARVPMETDSERGRPPERTPEDLATEAVNRLAMRFFKQMTPQRVKVDLKEKMLFVAADYFDGRYATAKKIDPSWDKFLLVVRGLPEECDQNEFRLALAGEGDHRNAFEQPFTWLAEYEKDGYAATVPGDALRGLHGANVIAKLYVAGQAEPILERKLPIGGAGE